MQKHHLDKIKNTIYESTQLNENIVIDLFFVRFVINTELDEESGSIVHYLSIMGSCCLLDNEKYTDYNKLFKRIKDCLKLVSDEFISGLNKIEFKKGVKGTQKIEYDFKDQIYFIEMNESGFFKYSSTYSDFPLVQTKNTIKSFDILMDRLYKHLSEYVQFVVLQQACETIG